MLFVVDTVMHHSPGMKNLLYFSNFWECCLRLCTLVRNCLSWREPPRPGSHHYSERPDPKSNRCRGIKAWPLHLHSGRLQGNVNFTVPWRVSWGFPQDLITAQLLHQPNLTILLTSFFPIVVILRTLINITLSLLPREPNVWHYLISKL